MHVIEHRMQDIPFYYVKVDFEKSMSIRPYKIGLSQKRARIGIITARRSKKCIPHSLFL